MGTGASASAKEVKERARLARKTAQEAELALLQPGDVHVLRPGDLIVARFPAFAGEDDNPWFAGTIGSILEASSGVTVDFADGDHGAISDMAEIRYAPSRPDDWGKGDLRGNDLLPEDAVLVSLPREDAEEGSADDGSRGSESSECSEELRFDQLEPWFSHLSSQDHPFPTEADFHSALDKLKVAAEALEAEENGYPEIESEEGFASASWLAQILMLLNEVSLTGFRQHVCRVNAGWGWALHGLAFELSDGTRLGEFLQNNGSKMDLLGDDALARRGGNWTALSKGERILEVRGHNCTEGYLAYDVELVTSRGRTLHFSADHPAWRGSSFEFTAPDGQEIECVNFDRGRYQNCNCVSFLDYSGDEVRGEQFKSTAEKVMEILAKASKCKGPQEAKYALMQAESLELQGLPCFEGFHQAILGELELPSFWDMSLMKTDEVESDRGLTFHPEDNVNMFGEKELDDDEIGVLQGLIDASFRKRYTRDRRGAKVPDGMKLCRGLRIQNAMNWAEFATRVEAVKAELSALREAGEEESVEALNDSVDELKTAGVLPEQPEFELDTEANCAWLWHGTNDEAAACITKGDFLINKAGSNAGTLYGRGIYLAESCSKSDEYSIENDDGLRCILLCRATLGNINYNDETHPDVNRLVRSCVKGPCHCVLGDREKCRGTFREFIVYDDDQVYPEYLLWYRRVYE